MTNKFYIDVALPVPLRKTFYYLPQQGTSLSDYKIGARVKVPFGSRYLIGIINKIVNNNLDKTKIKLKSINQVIDYDNILSQNIIDLVHFAAQYYQYPIGEVYACCLPKPIRAGKNLNTFENKSVYLNTDANFLLQNKKLSKSQIKLIKLLQENNDALSLFSLNHLGIKNITINKLVEENWIYIKDNIDHVGVSKSGQAIIDNKIFKQRPLELNVEQQQAVAEIKKSLDNYSSYLLYGITGSGKTEVYLNIIASILSSGKQALVLVPEISLTPQTINRFKNRFNTKIAVIHSKVNLTNKAQDWLAAKNNTAKIIIGTRSAIFTPIKDLGVIIIDEEHDNSFKQQEGFRYNGRDLAVIRAKRLNIPVILGSATPSIESVANIINNKYKLLRLTNRAGSSVLPHIKLLNIKNRKLNSGLSDSLISLISSKLRNQEQVLLFLNRRGYAPVLKCNDCSWGGICDRCNVYYTVHRQENNLSCHYCTSFKKMPINCPDCGSVDLISFGYGTEQIEDYIKQKFSNYECIRVDRDTTRNKNDLEQHLAKINQQKPVVLLGTQMLAKGHHFPNVTLVAILDVDNSLFSTDFRAPEKISQLLIQVAGRAGRGSKPSEVVIQTTDPNHKLLQDIISKDYWEIATELYNIRKLANQPPLSTWALIRAESNDLNKTMEFLNKVKELYCNKINNEGTNKINSNINILGPILAPRVKKAGLLRGQLLLTSNNRLELQSALSKLIEEADNLKFSSVRWSVDVDPQDIY